MHKIIHSFSWITLSIICLMLLSSCAQKQNPTFSQSNLVSERVIFFAHVHYPGVPEPTKTPQDKYCEYLPKLMIWGDGFAFLDEKIENNYNSVMSGILDQAALQDLTDILNSENFFTGSKVSVPNPSGTRLWIGARVTGDAMTEYTIGDLGPPLLTRLIERFKPELTPLAEQSKIDARAEAIMKDNENCNEYMY